MSALEKVKSDIDPQGLFCLPEQADSCRIVVAMSGGVDSSVVAALAAASGAEVIGITLQLYDYGAATGRKGMLWRYISDARDVANRGYCTLCLRSRKCFS